MNLRTLTEPPKFERLTKTPRTWTTSSRISFTLHPQSPGVRSAHFSKKSVARRDSISLPLRNVLVPLMALNVSVKVVSLYMPFRTRWIDGSGPIMATSLFNATRQHHGIYPVGLPYRNVKHSACFYHLLFFVLDKVSKFQASSVQVMCCYVRRWQDQRPTHQRFWWLQTGRWSKTLDICVVFHPDGYIGPQSLPWRLMTKFRTGMASRFRKRGSVNLHDD